MEIYGTCYFVSRSAAIEYYRDYVTDRGLPSAAAIVDRKIADDLIRIGKPTTKVGDTLVMLDNGRRYGLRSA